MKNSMTRLLCGVAVLAAFAAGFVIPMKDANALTANVPITASLNIPLVLGAMTAIAFGTIVMDSAGDTITVSPAGVRSKTGASVLTGTPANGVINITGTANAAITVTPPAAPVVVSGLTGGGSAQFNNFTIGGSPTALDGTGAIAITVGADLVYTGVIDNGKVISTTAGYTIAYN